MAAFEHIGDPAPRAFAIGKIIAEVIFKKEALIQPPNVKTERAVELNQVLDSASAVQATVAPYAFEIEQKQRGRLSRAGSDQNIRVLEVVVIDVLIVQSPKQKRQRA
jgi:hypothetical protein